MYFATNDVIFNHVLVVVILATAVPFTTTALSVSPFSSLDVNPFTLNITFPLTTGLPFSSTTCTVTGITSNTLPLIGSIVSDVLSFEMEMLFEPADAV